MPFVRLAPSNNPPEHIFFTRSPHEEGGKTSHEKETYAIDSIPLYFHFSYFPFLLCAGIEKLV
jgi:hypothetical protein